MKSVSIFTYFTNLIAERDEEVKRENKMLLDKMVEIERKTSIVGLM